MGKSLNFFKQNFHGWCTFISCDYD